jgi:hypothetical protein
MSCWLGYMEALEANVERGWALLSDPATLAEKDDVLIDIAPSPDLGPCPPELNERGLKLLADIDALERAILNRQEELARELQRRPASQASRDRVGWGLSINM